MARIISHTLLVAAVASKALASCAYGTHLFPREEAADGTPVVKVNTFGYAGSISPLNWVALDAAANAACATGTRQSPIDMVDGVFQMVAASDLSIDIPDMAEGTEFENLGTTVEVIAKGGTMNVANTTYTLQQFHFHLPSEHLDNGTSMAMEMHMVWQSEAQEIAVIGVYIDIDPQSAAPAAGNATVARRQLPEGVQAMGKTAALAVTPADSVLLETVFSSIDQIVEPGTFTETQPLVMSELVSLLNAGSFQSYSGSLTTPPCSEGVTWLVSTQHLMVQTATFQSVRDVIGFNSRYPQNSPGEPNLLQLAATAATA